MKPTIAINAEFDLDQVPDGYKLSPDRLERAVACLRTVDGSAMKKWISVMEALYACMQDVYLMTGRLEWLGLAPDAVAMGNSLLDDLGAGRKRKLSDIAAFLDAAGRNDRTRTLVEHARAMFRADLRSCVQSWQMWTALSGKATAPAENT